MNLRLEHPKRFRLRLSALLGSLICMMSMQQGFAQSALKGVGEIADTFELTDIRTGESFDLSQAEGSIIFLDFFFYW